MKHLWLNFTKEDVRTETLQCEQEGRDISSLKSLVESILSVEETNEQSQEKVQSFFLSVSSIPIPKIKDEQEPNDFESLIQYKEIFTNNNTIQHIEDKIYGAWVGRCCGCLLGKPVEGWKRFQIESFLKETSQFPLSFYFSRGCNHEVQERYQLHEGSCFIEEVHSMPEDDDLNYTVVGLGIYEKWGSNFTSENVADYWLENLPILSTCTAERIAYKNFINGIYPPQSASYNNPYREWIGAQIRADFWGYINPGDPLKAAEFAWRDARVSHVKNGIYGEVWVSAMIALAFILDDAEKIISESLKFIPSTSRLYSAIQTQLRNRRELSNAQLAIEDVHERWNENNPHDWCHTISNAEVVAMALLWGENDFEKTITLATTSAFDTDCNSATCGSIIGAMIGEKSIPTKWKNPLNDTLESGVRGYNKVKISELADRTLQHLKNKADS